MLPVDVADVGMRVEAIRRVILIRFGRGENRSASFCVSGLVDTLKEGFVLLPEGHTQKDYERMFQIQLAHK